MKVITSLLVLVVTSVVMLGVIEVGRADPPSPVQLAQATPAAGSAVTVPPFEPSSGSAAAPAEGSGSAMTPAPTASSPPPLLTPQAEDIGVLTKLWKNGSFFTLAVIGAYLGLAAWSKLDKKHAWYAATAAGALMFTIEGIRKGDTPTAQGMATMALGLGGVLIKGPGHT